MAKIVKPDQNISGMEIIAIFNQYLAHKRYPFIKFYEGPKFKYICELFIMHTIGRLLVKMDIKYPRAYKIYMRVTNSIKFRFNYYRRKLIG